MTLKGNKKEEEIKEGKEGERRLKKETPFEVRGKYTN